MGGGGVVVWWLSVVLKDKHHIVTFKRICVFLWTKIPRVSWLTCAFWISLDHTQGFTWTSDYMWVTHDSVHRRLHPAGSRAFWSVWAEQASFMNSFWSKLPRMRIHVGRVCVFSSPVWSTSRCMLRFFLQTLLLFLLLLFLLLLLQAASLHL